MGNGPVHNTIGARNRSRYHFRVRRALPYILFGLVTLVVFWSFIRSGRTLYNVDGLRAALGQVESAPPGAFPTHVRNTDNVFLLPNHLRIYNEGLKAGEVRLWNPTLFCGHPLYADPMVHPFYPPNLILHWAFPPDTAFELSLMVHLFFSGASMLWLMRTLRVSDAGGTIAGLAWMLFGYNAMWFSTGILLGVGVFVPLALKWVVEGVESRNLRRAPQAALAMGMVILGSHPQHALHFFLFILGWIFVAAVRNREARGFILKFALVYSGLSVGVALVEVLARLDSILNGFRKAGPDMSLLYGHPWALLGQAVGVALGRIQFHNIPTLDPEFNVYAGSALFTLAVTGAVRCFREPTVRFVALFGAAAFLVAFIRPLAELWQWVPFLRLSPPSRWLCVFGFCLALLAGRGLDSLSSGLGKIPILLGSTGALFVMVCLAKVGPLNFANKAAAGTALTWSITTIAAFLARRRPSAGACLAMLSILFELLSNFKGMNQHYDPTLLRNPPSLVEVPRGHPEDPWRCTGWFVAPRTNGEPPGTGNSFGPLGDNALSVYGLETLGGFEAIIPAAYLRFCEEAGGKHTAAGRAVTFRDVRSPLLDLAGLRYVFRTEALPPGDPFRRVASSGPTTLYENANALPRAYVVAGARVAHSEEEAAKALHEPGFNPRESVVLQTSEDLPWGPGGSVASEVRWVQRSSDGLRLEVSSPHDGYLVLSEADYPGWQATVDGQRTSILRANLAFRAIRLPRGRHHVVFRFSPWIFRWGGIGSIVSAALVLGWIAVPRFRSSGGMLGPSGAQVPIGEAPPP
jgi:hypothetical protein